MKIKEFEIEESKVNKGCLNLIAIAENGSKYVVSGDFHSPTYLIPYETAWDTRPDNEHVYTSKK
jgi:hypothetical protein